MTVQWRKALAAGGISALLVLTACGAPTAGPAAPAPAGDVPDRPSEPVTLNILDVAGNLQLTQPMIVVISMVRSLPFGRA